MSRYFGQPWGPALSDPRLIAQAPKDAVCFRCEEPIGDGDQGALTTVIDAEGKGRVRAEHRECFIRAIAGSVGHQRGRCSCYGGTEEDPPGLSRREAARAAMLEFLGFSRCRGFRRIEPIGTKVGYGHVAAQGGHYWGEIPLPQYPDSPRGRALRDLRVAREISLRDAANALGLSVVDLSLLERGGAACDWEHAESILGAMPATAYERGGTP